MAVTYLYWLFPSLKVQIKILNPQMVFRVPEKIVKVVLMGGKFVFCLFVCLFVTDGNVLILNLIMYLILT